MSENRYLDDFSVGERFTTPGITLTESEVIDFAMKYDPQAFHLDVNAAGESLYGGLIASGFQTLSLSFRLFIQSGLLAKCSLGSPGIDELRWLAPVRPGDTLHTRVEVLEVNPSRSKPERGILRLRYEAVNQHGDPVLSYIINHLLSRRPA
ncbi:MaoC family dehydratase [Motiliproteus sp. SC1-56]|uniref:MaoC family dehydratase n=1 Tax=Motiliproteus sp. SC1-56 TaxID=2799565 RepID=UPI001A90C4FB|nr:MaoC family dehydratase [Motiliproteus sp. SC1-56]